MRSYLYALLLCMMPLLSSSVIMTQSGEEGVFYGGTGHQMEYTSLPYERTDSIQINFDQPFRQVPQIALSIAEIDTGEGPIVCGTLSYSSASQTGFQLDIKADPYCGIFQIKASWFATISPFIKIGYYTNSNFGTETLEHTLIFDQQNNPGAVVFLAGLKQENGNRDYSITVDLGTVTYTSVKFYYAVGSSTSNNIMIKVCVIHYSYKHFNNFFSVTGSSSNPNGSGRSSLETYINQNFWVQDTTGLERSEIYGISSISNYQNMRMKVSSAASGNNLNVQVVTWWDTYIVNSKASYFFDINTTPTIKITVSE